MSFKFLTPDKKGRITLGPFAKGISYYTMSVAEDGKIILVPHTKIPEREKWIFQDKRLLKKIEQGIQDVTKGRLSKNGSFAKFIEADNE